MLTGAAVIREIGPVQLGDSSAIIDRGKKSRGSLEIAAPLREEDDGSDDEHDAKYRT